LVILCEVCGTEREGTVVDCRLCEVLARNAALEEEVKEVRGVLSETRQQLGEAQKQLQEVMQQVQEIRREASVRPLVTPKPDESHRCQEKDGWNIVVRGVKRRVNPPSNEVECSNRFGLLATQEEEVVIEIGEEEGKSTPKAKVVKTKVGGREKKVRERSQEVLVIGDSRIRYLDSTF